MPAIVARKVLGKQASKIYFTQIRKFQRLIFYQIKFLQSRWELNRIGANR